MSYTPHTWTTGETITAAKLNALENGAAEGGGYDAVIRLTHANDSSDDSTDNLTPSIVSGTYAGLYAMIDDGDVPNILVEYYHPWTMTTTFTPAITYATEYGITMLVPGYYPRSDEYLIRGPLVWTSEDSIYWNV